MSNELPTPSFSAIDDLLNCPRKFYYKRVCGIYVEGGAQVRYGLIYHDTLARMLRLTRMENRVLDLRDGEKLMNAAIEAAEKDVPEKDRLGDDLLRDEILGNLIKLIPLIGPGKFFPMMLCANPLVEQKFYSDKFKGVIDLVSENSPIVSDKGDVIGWQDNTPCVVDWKVTSSNWRKTARDAIFSEQLALYRNVLKIPTAVFVDIPRSPTRRIYVRRADASAEDSAVWEKWFTQMHASFQTLIQAKDPNLFPMCRRESGLCCPMYCEFYGVCYMGHPLDSVKSVPHNSSEETKP